MHGWVFRKARLRAGEVVGRAGHAERANACPVLLWHGLCRCFRCACVLGGAVGVCVPGFLPAYICIGSYVACAWLHIVCVGLSIVCVESRVIHSRTRAHFVWVIRRGFAGGKGEEQPVEASGVEIQVAVRVEQVHGLHLSDAWIGGSAGWARQRCRGVPVAASGLRVMLLRAVCSMFPPCWICDACSYAVCAPLFPCQVCGRCRPGLHNPVIISVQS